MGCTTYSFSLNLGCFFRYIPAQFPVRFKNGEVSPEEYQCHFRGRLDRTFDQRELDRNDIWYIDPNGDYLAKSMDDVLLQIKDRGFAWFDRFIRPEEVKRTLLKDDEQMAETWGFGRNPSPIRSYMMAYTAMRLGDNSLADAKLQEAVQSGCFKSLFVNTKEAKDRFGLL